jgi:hypothetical protein
MTFQNESLGNDTTIWIINGTDTVSSTHLEWIFSESEIGNTVEITFIVASDTGCSDTIIRNYEVLENRTDLAVNQVFTQVSDGFYIVGVELENRGSAPITGADLLLRTTNTPLIKETWSGQLEAGQKEIYVFSAQVSATISAEVELENFICVEAILTAPIGFADEDLTNNERCYSKEGNESILLVPFPNPTRDVFNIRIILPEDGAATLKVYDVLGKLVATIAENTSLSKGVTNFSVDASQWSDGTYSIVLVSGKQQKTSKVQVVR